MRPVVTMVNSLPHVDQDGHSDRTNGFGASASSPPTLNHCCTNAQPMKLLPSSVAPTPGLICQVS
jgi:hypothetical protein